MKLVRFIPHQSFPKIPRLGAMLESTVVDLASAYRSYLVHADLCTVEAAHRISSQLIPSSTVEFLENGSISMNAAENAIDFVQNERDEINGEKWRYAPEEIRLLAPIENPRNLRDFISFEKHIKNARERRGKEVPKTWYEIPAYYKGNVSTIIGPNDDVDWPTYTEKLDYELEFACIIGKNGKDIPKSKAENHIFGYTIMNDFSARDIQMKEMSVGLGPAKGKDFATALGPYIATKDEISDPYNLKMIAKVNGEIWSEGNSNTIHRTFPELIEYVSQSETIAAGDVFGSGTVGWGCGLELGKFLKENDVVELEIEGLGVLQNRVVKNAHQSRRN